MERKILGRYIVADPEICHGKPTFAGTRIMVWQVLELVALDWDWEAISRRWSGRIPAEAIAEAVRLANAALMQYVPEPEEVSVAS